MNEMQQKVSAIGVVPVIKLTNPTRDAGPLSDALCAGGVPVAEITFRAAGADEAMRIMLERHPDMLVFADAAPTTEMVDKTIAAGGKFVVTPGLDVEIVKYCQEKGLVVIGDAKRGDIGSTSAAYATAHLGKVKVGNSICSAFNTDFLTVNPYLGTDGVKPFVDVCNAEDKGIFVLVKTSNPSSGEFQDRLIDGKPLYEHVAAKVVEWGEASMDGAYSNVGAVVGATYPEMSAVLRKLMPKTYFLVPGYGAQGGTAKDLKNCFNEDGLGAVVNSSRGIIAAYRQEKYAKFGAEHFAEASRQAVIDMVADINSVL